MFRSKRSALPRCRLGLEQLETRAVCSVTFSGPGATGDAVIKGTSLADRFTLRLEDGNPGHLLLSDGVIERTAVLSDVREITIEGLAGADKLVLDQRRGVVGRDDPNVLPISFNGGTGADELLILNEDGTEQTTQVDVVTLIATPATGGLSLVAPAAETGDNGVLFLGQLYEERLGRPATSNELTYWFAVLQQPQGREKVTSGIAESSEGRIHQVQEWYATWLGRTPAASSAEMQIWLNAFRAGARDEQVAATILASDEYFRRQQTSLSGVSDADFVRGLYRDLLNRSGSSADVEWWLEDLPAQGRAGVALGFLQSPEYRQQQVTQLYANLLGRQPDDAGLEYWLDVPLTLQEIRLAIERSPEFYQHAGVTL